MQIQFVNADATTLPRMLLRTADGRYSVQLQNDRFGLGWHRPIELSTIGGMLASAVESAFSATLTDATWQLPNRRETPRPPTHLQQTFIDQSLSRTSPLWMTHLENNAKDLALLRPGWDGSGSIPISKKMLYRASSYVRTALDGLLEASPPRLVPGGDGSIQIEWHAWHGELEFDIGPSDEMTIWIRDRRNGAEFDGENQAALALFYRWAPWIASRQRNGSDAIVQDQIPFLSFAA